MVKQQLESDLNQALKSKNELVSLVLRQLKTAITNAEIAKNRAELTNEEIIKILRSEVKKRKEAASLYKQGGRQELADREFKEIEVVNQYLPPELGEDDIKQKIAQIIEQIGASSPQDFGKVIGLAMKEFAGQADGNIVSSLVKEALAK